MNYAKFAMINNYSDVSFVWYACAFHKSEDVN